MCLGDIRFMPYVRTNVLRLTVTTAYTEVLPRNPNRVGILWPSCNELIGRCYPIVSPGAVTQGIVFSDDQELKPNLHITFEKHGDLTTVNWFATITFNTTVLVLEQTVPAHIMAEVRKIGLGAGEPLPAL